MCFNVPTLFYTDNCNFVSNLNIFTILSAFQTLEYDDFFLDNALIFAKRHNIFLK